MMMILLVESWSGDRDPGSSDDNDDDDDGDDDNDGDDDDDLYIIGAVCLYVCMSVCMSVTKRHHFSYSRDLVNSYQTKKKTLPEKNSEYEKKS